MTQGSEDRHQGAQGGDDEPRGGLHALAWAREEGEERDHVRKRGATGRNVHMGS